MSISTQQRRDFIINQVLDAGHVSVKSLAGKMAVSEATVRRDLRTLADLGQLELVYGGATLPRSSDFSFRSKAQRFVEEKRVIGRLAATLVGDGESLFLDSGTTIHEMAPYLKRRRRLSVIVNSLRLAAELGASPDLEVITLGGKYRPEYMDTVGPLATESLERLRGFRTFIGADGLSPDFGVTASDIESAHLFRLAIRHAREVILLVDHSKFLAPSLFKICEFDDISRIVTDKEPPAEWVAFLNEKGIEIHTPAMSSPGSNGAFTNKE